MRFARWAYRFAAITGPAALVPMYFLEGWVGRNQPPAITHPEHYYGFLGVAAVWQIAFLVIASDPARFRPLMPVTVLEKLGFSVPALILYARGRMAVDAVPVVLFDLALGVLFLLAWYRSRPRAQG